MGRLSTLTTRETWIWILVGTVLIELVTVFFRFGVRMESTRDTQVIGHFTGGIRIHHGYVGLLIAAVGLCLAPGAKRNLALVVGGTLFFSDMVHHFLVLWPITGSPQFDLTYPSGAPRGSGTALESIHRLWTETFLEMTDSDLVRERNTDVLTAS